MRSLVVGIDPGYRNLSVCVVDRALPAIAQVWRVENIVPRIKKPTVNQVMKATRLWCETNKDLLDTAQFIVIEDQMRSNFQVQAAVIWALYSDKAHIIHPFTLCRLYNLPKKRAAKKQETIRYIRNRCTTRMVGSKIDDLADSCLLAYYGLDHLVQNG